MSHDGSHITDADNCFEWWYFDFDLKDKKQLYIEFHAPIFNLRDDHCMLIIRLYDHNSTNKNNANNETLKDLPIKVFRYPRTSVGMHSDICQIQFPGGNIVENDSGYLIQINEDGLIVNITLKKTLPIAKIFEKKLFETKDGKESLFWNVPLPVAQAEGSLELEGQYMCIEGLAYHDHNWGNLNFGQYLDRWNWARVHFQNYTLIFADIYPRKISGSDAFCIMINDDGTIFETDSMELAYYDYSVDGRYQLHFPQKAVLELRGENVYKIELIVDKILKVTEVPLGSWRNHHINSLITISYYLLKWSFLPNKLKRSLGRLVYLQARLKCKLYIDNVLNDQTSGNLEVFSLNT